MGGRGKAVARRVNIYARDGGLFERARSLAERRGTNLSALVEELVAREMGEGRSSRAVPAGASAAVQDEAMGRLSALLPGPGELRMFRGADGSWSVFLRRDGEADFRADPGRAWSDAEVMSLLLALNGQDSAWSRAGGGRLLKVGPPWEGAREVWLFSSWHGNVPGHVSLRVMPWAEPEVAPKFLSCFMDSGLAFVMCPDPSRIHSYLHALAGAVCPSEPAEVVRFMPQRLAPSGWGCADFGWSQHEEFLEHPARNKFVHPGHAERVAPGLMAAAARGRCRVAIGLEMGQGNGNGANQRFLEVLHAELLRLGASEADAQTLMRRPMGTVFLDPVTGLPPF